MRDKWVRWRETFGSETEYIIRLWSCFSDPEQQASFLETLRERKKENPAYSIYEDYPTSRDPKNVAEKYCAEILEMLRGRKSKEGEGA